MKQNEIIENSNKKITKKGIVKFDPDTAKTLPISTNRKRTKGWVVEREYNGLILAIEAFESLNAYDLIALFQMLDDYSKNFELWQEIGEIHDDDFVRKLMQREFSLNILCKQRDIKTDKRNRETIAKSFERWYKTELIYKRTDHITKTRYLFEYKVDKDFKTITIVANTNFLDFCLTNGMAMNWARLVKYGKNYYALELDIYLQFRSIQYGKKTKKYSYPNTINEKTLFKHLGIETEVKDYREKRRKVKQAFKKFEEITGIKYFYDRKERKWFKNSYINN